MQTRDYWSESYLKELYILYKCCLENPELNQTLKNLILSKKLYTCGN
jgi:hypothetical protein